MTLRFDSVWGGGFALTKAFESGVSCLVGGWSEGPEQVFTLASGSRAPEHGRVTLDGADPFKSPTTRARIALADRSAWLPSAANVTLALRQLQSVHAPELASDSAQDSLDRFGVGHLAPRATASLTESERRAAVLCLALGLRAPRLLLLFEPWSIPGVDRRAVHDAINDAARTGTVLVATEHHKVAIELGASTSVFVGGRLLEAGSGAALSSSSFGCFRLTCADPRQLATALLALPEVVAVQAPLHSTTLEVTGVNPAALSLAILNAALSQGVRVDNLIEVPAQLDVLQAAVRGRADGTYAAAYQVAWQAQMAAGPQFGGMPQVPASGLQIFGAPRPLDQGVYSGRIDDGGRALAELPVPGSDVQVVATTDTPPIAPPATETTPHDRGNP